jgi:predicted nucleic-acid-binding protein
MYEFTVVQDNNSAILARVSDLVAAEGFGPSYEISSDPRNYNCRVVNEVGAFTKQVCVLRSRYDLAKEDIVTAFSALLDTADLAIEDEPSVENAVYSWKDSAADFADCLIEARNRRLGCRATATFDGRALKVSGFISV